MSGKDLKWYQRPVRMMRLDYLGEMNRIRESDLDALIRSKRYDWNIKYNSNLSDNTNEMIYDAADRLIIWPGMQMSYGLTPLCLIGELFFKQ